MVFFKNLYSLTQDKAMRKKLLMEMAPRRASDRIASKAQSREEEEIHEESERQRERERAAEERKKEEEEKQREKQQQAEKRQQGRGIIIVFNWF